MITNGVTFGDKHSYRDFGLYFNKFPVVAPPDPILNTIEIPGMDGQLNLSTSLDGYMHYKTRKMSLQFVYVGNRSDFFSVQQNVFNTVHGREMDIILDDDPAYRYHGIVTVGTPSISKKYDFILPVTVQCDAYKYERANSIEPWLWDDFDFDTGVIRDYSNLHVNGSLDVTLIGSDKPVYPDFVVSSDDGTGMQMTYNDIKVDLVDGTNVVAGMPVVRKSYDLHFTGNGTVSIVFDCGVL